MILFLHNRYRQAGGEERAVEDLLWLVRERCIRCTAPQTLRIRILTNLPHRRDPLSL